MKISEAKIKRIIAEEKQALLAEQKVSGAKIALREIAMLSAQLHDKDAAIIQLNEKEMLKLKDIAESLDLIFYNVTAQER